MGQISGEIYDAYIPDYEKAIVKFREGALIVECIASKVQQVLVLGGGRVSCNCLPIFPEDFPGALPAGDVGYIHPLMMYNIAHGHFTQRSAVLTGLEFAVIQEFIQSYYALGIQLGCQRVYWASVPTSDMHQDQFVLKNRPVVEIQRERLGATKKGEEDVRQGGLYVATTTNRGRYTTDGPVITNMGIKPGVVGGVPLFLPQNCLFGGYGAKFNSKKKTEIQAHLTAHLLDIFRSPSQKIV